MDKPGKWNPWFAALAGFLVFLGYSLFPVTALTPEMSAEAAVVTGLRPAAGVFPGLWRYLVSIVPPSAFWYGFIGRLAAAVFAALVYLAIRRGFSLLYRANDYSSVWSDRLAPAISILTALMCAFADPVWRVFSLFSPAALNLILVGVILVGFEAWIVKGRMWRLCVVMFLTGIFLSETPIAFVMPVAMYYAYRRLLKDIRNDGPCPRRDILSFSELPIWRMFLCLTAGILLGAAANLRYMVAHDTLGALGWQISMMLFHYLDAYLGQLGSAALASGWFLGLILMVVPMLIAIRMFPKYTDDDEKLPFHAGLILLLVGIIAYFEQSALRGAWFWTWLGEREIVFSPTLLAFFSVCASVAVGFAGANFTLDAFSASRSESRSDGVNRAYHWAVISIVVVLALFVLPSLPHSRIRRVLAFNDSAVKETIRELNGAKWLFTDGSADAALELEAHRQGLELRTINLMGGDSDYDVKLRLRGITEEGDRMSAQMGAPVLLRVWACDKEDGLAGVGLQLGLELWKREQMMQQPLASAFLAAPSCLRDEDVKDAGAIAKGFADRIEELTPDANSQDVSPSVRKEFFTISWRISRMARYRHDSELAEKLESLNTALRRMLRDLEYERLRVFMQMTPKEGLDFALKRADFTEAARYAAAVLKVNRDDARANFGMGMYFLLANRYENAEPYLRKVLEVRPDEPAALNNLSILCRKTKRYEEAVKLADRALKLLPENEEVQKTHRDALSKAP